MPTNENLMELAIDHLTTNTNWKKKDFRLIDSENLSAIAIRNIELPTLDFIQEVLTVSVHLVNDDILYHYYINDNLILTQKLSAITA